MISKKGKIITFYSYKGGTGRSMALANIAWILASNGKKVLVIDWDLEAPGLHRYFAPFLADPEIQSTDGLIDFLFEYVTASLTNVEEPKEDWYLPYTDLSRYTTSLINTNFKSKGTIDYVPAGKQDANYAYNVNTFDWMVFYEKLQGGTFLDIVKKQIKNDYDYILIDSRTGVSDTSGICTVQMPDAIVACFTYNVQSIDGVSAVLSSITKHRSDNRVAIYPVPTRVDNFETERLDRAKEYAKKKLNGFLRVADKEKYWGAVRVHYQPYYSYEEVLATIKDQVGDADSILTKMEIITNFVTNGEVTELISSFSEDEKQNILDVYFRKFRPETALETTNIIKFELDRSSKKQNYSVSSENHVFICYSNVDGLEIANKISNELEGGHPFISTWFDKRELQVGQEWDDQIARAIQNCSAILFIMTHDSVKSNSTCKQEWSLGLTYKKPIIPIQTDKLVETPFRLVGRQSIDFSIDFDQGMAKLRFYIESMNSPEGQLQILKDRLLDAQRDLRRARIEDRSRINAEIGELEAQIQIQERIVENPHAAQEQTQKNIEAGLERERQPVKPSATQTPTKFINPPPGIAPNYFQNRYVETVEIAKFLQDDAQRMMTIVGRGGVGKTAMVCRLLKGLEGGELPDGLGKMRVEGIVYLSESGSHRVNFANLFYDLCKLLPADAANALDAVYKNPQASSASKMSALLDRFTAGKVVLLLDNVEPLISVETFDIADAELDECLRALLHGAHSALKVILTTRVAPRGLNLYEPGKQRVLTLDSGLEQKYAVEMLREMDVDGKLGLKSADPEALKRAYERTLGFPRALEALFAILASDRYTTLEELLAMPTPVNVVEALVGEAFNRLDTNAQKVMQALAVYNRPVTPAAVDYLLAPHLPAMDSAPILQRLANMHFARKESGRFYLHPVDREFAFSLIPSPSPSGRGESSEARQGEGEYTQHDLTSRAADYFAQARKPRAEWKKLDDLNAQLAEFDLRCAAGDYDTAASVLRDFDFDYLLLWGHYRLMIQMHEKVAGKINDPDLKMGNLNGLGLAYQYLGNARKSITYFEQGIPAAQEAKSRGWEGAFLGNLGNAYADLGDAKKAIEFYEQALVIAREIGDRRNEGNWLGNLGNAYAALGDAKKAIEFYEQQLVIVREIGDRGGEGNALGNLGLAYADLGDAKKAIEFYEKRMEIAREIGDRGGEGNALGNLGNAYADLGDAKKAIEFYEKRMEIAREIGDRRGEGNALGNLGNAYAALGDAKKAIEFYEQSLVIDREIGDRSGEAASIENKGLALLSFGEYKQSIEFLSRGIEIADEISRTDVQQEGRWGIAQAYLFQNDLTNAHATIEAALQYDVPMYNHNVSTLHGIIALRQGDEVAARGAFVRAIGQADEILSKTAEYYSALDAKGIAICGLLICDLPPSGTSRLGRGDPSMSTETNDSKPMTPDKVTVSAGRDALTIDDAIETFRKARKIAPHAGVVKSVLRLFDELVKCGQDGVLKNVRAAVEGKE